MATAIDRRRNNGPQSSYKPEFESPLDTIQSPESESKTEFFLNRGFINHATGSSFYESGGTKITTSIQGPRPIPKSSSFSSAAHHGVVTVQVWRQSSRLDGVLSSLVSRALEKSVIVNKYPKSEIYVAIQVLQEPDLKSSQDDDAEEEGDEVSEEVVVGCIVAASCALVDAGIHLYDIVSAASLSLVNGQIKSSHHNTSIEHDKGTVGLVLGYMPNREEVTLMHLTGSGAQQADIDVLLKAAIKHAEAVHAVMTRVLTQQ